MKPAIQRFDLLFILALLLSPMKSWATDLWLTLPPTPGLPAARTTGSVSVPGAQIWYATFGQGDPVLLLHSGLGNSNYFGNLIPVLAKDRKVIVIDSRGHSRSTNDGRQLSYDLMASDVVAVLDYLKINKVSLVGWRDGAIIGLDLAVQSS